MAAIHAGCFPPGECWSATAIADQLVLPGTFGLIDPGGGMVLARVAADEAEILTLAMLPSSRRQGRARRLLQAAEDQAGSAGAGVMFLEVSERNIAARALYAAAGYLQAGRRPRYYPGGIDALLLRKQLIPGATTTG
ncbi:Ribosomal-protein-S18p-alanine acetyltransferase [Rhodovastum atsumiense]|nr:Ribosomal-protein-S18p-alanine acetyltransferase [Rhodovastum atsumiense]